MILYTPAAASSSDRWLLFAGDRTALLVDVAAAASRPTDDRVTDLFAAVQSDNAVRSTLDLLTVGGLSSVPAFVLASWSGSGAMHLLVRGAGDVAVETASGTEAIDSSAVSTWVERVIPGARSIRVGAAAGGVGGAGAGAGIGGGALPLDSGVVWASAAVMAAPGVEPAVVETVAMPVSEVVEPEVVEPEAVEPVVAEPVSAEPAAPAAQVIEPEVIEPEVAPQRISAPPVAPIVTPPSGASSRHVPDVLPIAPLLIAPAPGISNVAGAAAATSTSPIAVKDHPVNDAVTEETVMRDVDDTHSINAPEGDHDGETIMSGDLVGRGEVAGDHDGETIMSGDLVGRRAARAEAGANAPRVPVARELTLVLSTGARERLTDTIIVGRAPSVSQVSSGRVPQLVTIPGDQDISRSHAQFTLEGDTVVVTDLHSRNGTSIILPGKAPQLLRQGEPTAVLVDTVIDLGGGITVTVTDNAMDNAMTDNA